MLELPAHEGTLTCFKKMKLAGTCVIILSPDFDLAIEAVLLLSLGLMMKKSMLDHVLFPLELKL